MIIFISKEEAMEIVLRMENTYKLQNEIFFSDGRIKAPDVFFFPDSVSFYDSSRNMIHIGIYGIVDLFKIEDEADLRNGTTYMLGHEEQHAVSTAARPYQIGLIQSRKAVLEYISSQVDTSKRRFRTDADYAKFVTELPDMGVYISLEMLDQIIGGIQNSIEDGRIERIRSFRYPGFGMLRRIYRCRFWTNDTYTWPSSVDAEKNPSLKLEIICNQILSLATCQLYQKGFTTAFIGSPTMKQVNDLMPFIAKGVLAAKTRDMATQSIEICKMLAPLIFEACRMSAEDIAARQILERLIASLIKAQVDGIPSMNLSEADEDTEEGNSGSTFPISDLVVTLDDETYDKLMENSKKSDGNGGIMIKREHPKEEEQNTASKHEQSDSASNQNDSKKQGNSGTGNGKEDSSEDKKQDTENARTESSGADNPKAGEEAKTGNTAGASDGTDEANAKPGNAKNTEAGHAQAEPASEDNAEDTEGGSDKDSSKESSASNQKGSNTAKGAETKGPSNQHASQKSALGTSDFGHSDMKDILASMKEAAEQMREEAKADIERTVNATAHAASVPTKVVLNQDKPLTQADVKDICGHFKELYRQYPVTEKLPFVLMQRGRNLLRKMQMFFKSLSTPNVSFLDSGTVDPSRLYGLAMGDTEVFRKKGTDKKFDGCAYILIDNSGSMSGNKRTEACKAAAVIEEGFRGIMPIKIVAFDFCGDIVHEVIKGFDEQQRQNCCWNFCLHGRYGSGNEDEFDIAIASMELQKRPEKKKLLIVLSDGAPGSPSRTKSAIQKARKEGVQVCGIYFEEGSIGSDADTFKEMYEKDFICCELSEVDANLTQIMKRFSKS